jgi:hypothetical protein
VAEFKEAYGQDFDEQIKNLAVEYEQTADGNTEAYFTLLTLAEGTVLLNGVYKKARCLIKNCSNLVIIF